MDTSNCLHCGKALWQIKLSEKRAYCSDKCKVAYHRAKKNPVKRLEIVLQPTLQGVGRFYLTDERGNVFGPSFGSLAEFQAKIQLHQLIDDPRQPDSVIKPVCAPTTKRHANTPLQVEDEEPAICPFCADKVPYSPFKQKSGYVWAHCGCVKRAKDFNGSHSDLFSVDDYGPVQVNVTRVTYLLCGFASWKGIVSQGQKRNGNVSIVPGKDSRPD